MKNHISLLDPLRFIAAFWVMNFHYFQGELGEIHWYRYGNLGVQLFFIISGFVIVYSLHKKTITNFAKSRFIRLFPLFWIICSLTYLITLLVPGARPLLFAEYLSSMTMLGDQFNGYAGFGGLIDASYWTLGVELIFYFMIGIFVWLFSYKQIRYFLLIWFIFSVTVYIFNADNNYYIRLGLVHHSSYFIFGGSLALIVMKQARSIYEKLIEYFLLFGSVTYSTYIISYIYRSPFILSNFDITAVTLINAALFILFICAVYYSKKVTNSVFILALAIMGGLTYPLYLLHQTIGTTTINYLMRSNIFTRNTITILFEVAIILIAYFVYIYDTKMREWLLKYL